MRHITSSTVRPRSGALAECHAFRAPNLVVFSRANKPPIFGQTESKPRPEKGDNQGGKKQEIRGFSVKSSLNLARFLSVLDWQKLGAALHVTFTYHKRWPRGREELDREKRALILAWGRLIPAGFWKLEFQTRKPTGEKVPHWHVLAFLGDNDPGIFMDWCRSWWAKHSGNTSFYGVKFTQGEGAKARWYLTLHAAKKDQTPNFAVGRWWGYIGKQRLQAAVDCSDVGAVDSRSLVWWARLYRRKNRTRTRNGMGFSWFLPRGWQCTVAAWVSETVSAERARHHPHAKNPF